MASEPGRGIAYFHLTPAFAWTMVCSVLGGAVFGGSVIWHLSSELRDVRTVTDEVRRSAVIERVSRIEERLSASATSLQREIQGVNVSLARIEGEMSRLRTLIIEQMQRAPAPQPNGYRP